MNDTVNTAMPEQPSGWVRLLDVPDGLAIGRGALLRCAVAEYAYESVVDFMVVERAEGASGVKLLVASGYKAGATRQVLPEAACWQGHQYAIDSGWLKANWAEWVYPECPVEQVWFLAEVPVPTVPTPGQPAPRTVWYTEDGQVDITEADLYHSLADEFHLDAGQLLDEVLQRHDLPLAQRREITSSFMFQLMERLDEGAVYQLEDQAFEIYPKLATRTGARVPWRASLAFLWQLPAQHDDEPELDENGEAVLQLGELHEVLLWNETGLHELCGDPPGAYFDQQGHAAKNTKGEGDA